MLTREVRNHNAILGIVQYGISLVEFQILMLGVVQSFCRMSRGS